MALPELWRLHFIRRSSLFKFPSGIDACFKAPYLFLIRSLALAKASFTSQ